MKTHPLMLLNNLEREQRPIMPDLGIPLERGAKPATCDRWGHVCSTPARQSSRGHCPKTTPAGRHPEQVT